MKYTKDELMRLQERGALTTGQAAKLLTGRNNARTAAYAAFWLRHVEREKEKRLKQLTAKS